MKLMSIQITHRRILDMELSVPPPSNANNTNSSLYISEKNFDTNMVIILAALLCSLIGALGLNSIARCVIRCNGRRQLAAAATAERFTVSRIVETGLKNEDLRQIPIMVYKTKTRTEAETGTRIPDRVTECPICLGEFMDGEKVRVLPKCKHGFHVKCIDTWLLSHSSCPNCRLSLLEKHASSSSR